MRPVALVAHACGLPATRRAITSDGDRADRLLGCVMGWIMGKIKSGLLPYAIFGPGTVFCVALRDPVRGKAQSRRQASDLHPLVVRPVVAATRSGRRADDLPQPLSQKTLLDRDFGVSGAVLQASEVALQAQRARRRRKGGGRAKLEFNLGYGGYRHEMAKASCDRNSPRIEVYQLTGLAGT